MIRTALAVILIPLGLATCFAACKGGGDDAKSGAEETKKAFDTFATQSKEPLALIAAYKPYVTTTDETADAYAPKNRGELMRAATAASNEIRHAANGLHQTLPSAGGDALKELDGALVAVSTTCAEAVDEDALGKCRTAIDGLDKQLEKAQGAASAAGASGAIARLVPASVTDQAKKATAPFLKARGPGAQEKAYFAKRADTNASIDDVISACQAAAAEVDGISKQFEHADEPLRVLAVTHKMSMDSQCNKVSAADGLRKDVDDCRKKPKTNADCKIVCGKARAVVDAGVPAAALTPMQKDVADVCKD